jgi:small subunit ribosomal protein S19e
MVSAYSVDPNELIEKVAESLKSLREIQPPEWATFVKTGTHKQRPPTRPDWWYVRAAAVLRSVFKLGPIGVSKLRVKYGGKKDRGHKPEEFRKGSGNILRKILQQLEKAGLIKKVDKGVHKGRIVTGRGKSILDKAAIAILKSSKKENKIVKVEEQPKQEAKKEEKIKEKNG